MTNKNSTLWDWQSSTILIFLMLTVAVRLENTNWAADLGYVESIAIAGTVLGFLIGASRFSGFQKGLLVFFYSLVYLPLALSNILEVESTGLAKLLSLTGRLQVAIDQVIQAQPVPDALFFVTLMAILFWFLGISSGYQLLQNRDVNKILLAPTVVVLVIQYFDGLVTDRIWNLAVYFFLSLVLVGRINLLRSRDRWVKEGVIAGTQPEYDLNRFMLFFSVIVILFAWLIPYPSEIRPMLYRGINSIKEGSTAVQDRFENIFAALTPSLKMVGPNRFPQNYGLGENAEVGNEELFEVNLAGQPNPHYWPVRVYSRYRNYLWTSDTFEETLFDPAEGSIAIENSADTKEVEVTIQWTSEPVDLLVKPNNTVWVSRVVEIQTDQGSGVLDPKYMRVIPNLQNGDVFTARYAIEKLTQKDLKEASTVYPEEILTQYLDLASQPSERILYLANEITAGSTNTFEKVTLVTNYLRENYEYANSVGPIPEGQDPVEWFLFTERSGFCNYYASAEVLLLRSIGIPARLVVGYTGGELNEEDRLVFQKKNTHAWPEVYFPEIGWVEFEPTSSIDPIVLPSGDIIASPFQSNANSEFSDREQNPQMDVELDTQSAEEVTDEINAVDIESIAWSIGLGLLLLICIFIVLRRERLNLFLFHLPAKVQQTYTQKGRQIPAWVNLWVRWNDANWIERHFSVVNVSLRMFGVEVKKHQSPAERSKLLIAMLPDAKTEIELLYQELEKSLFSPDNNTKPKNSLMLALKILFKSLQKGIRILAYGN
jgi:transglutaminase-like putative cysteine protease